MAIKLICVNWTEHEAGWGCRPDGHTLHISLPVAQAFIADFQANTLARSGGRTPREYSSPSTPFEVEVDRATHDRARLEHSFWGDGTGWLR